MATATAGMAESKAIREMEEIIKNGGPSFDSLEALYESPGI